MKYIEIDRLKKFIEKIKEKKQRIESNYFNTLNLLNEALKTTSNDQIITNITSRKQKLDLATNTALDTLDRVERNLKNALYEIENDIENNNWEDFDKAREIANDIDIAANIDPNFALNTRLEYVKELRDIVEYGDISNSANDAQVYEFESVHNDFESSLDEFNRSVEFESPAEVKAGLLNDEQYAFEDKLNILEKKLDREIEKLKVQGQTLEEHKDAILNAIHNLEINSLQNGSIFGNNSIKLAENESKYNPELYFAALDKSVNNAVSKLDDMTAKMGNAIAILASEQVLNLEKISLPLIKSLEITLNNLSSDVSSLKKENSDYRRQLDDCKKIIDSLTQNNREKEMELDSSYRSWLETSRKLSDLEEVILEQSKEIQILDDDKNQIITDLEKKILDTSDFLTQTIYEKEMLMRENEELVSTIKRIQYEQEEKQHSAIDDYVNSVSIQELIEKEANKIVQTKISTLMSSYQTELEKIKNESLNHLLNTNESPTLANSVFDEFIFEEEKKSEIDVLNETIKKFEKQIESLEQKIALNDKIKEKTQDTINDLNKVIGDDAYNMIDEEKSYLSKKFGELEKKIEESLHRVTELEDQKIVETRYEMTEDELNNLFMSSPLYNAIKSELHGREQEITVLKSENEKIIEENQVMNYVLDDALKKMTINAGKMKEIEELMTKQEYEFMILNDEKNNVIEKLYATLKDRDLSNIDELNQMQTLDKYDFNDFARRTLEQTDDYNTQEMMFYVRDEVEKIVNDELRYLKNKYNSKLNEINEKYTEQMNQSLEAQVKENENDFDELINDIRSDFQGSNLLGENEILDELKEKQKYYDDTIEGLDTTIDSKKKAWEVESKNKVNTVQSAKEQELQELNDKNAKLEQRIKELEEIIISKSDEAITNNYYHDSGDKHTTNQDIHLDVNNVNQEFYDNLRKAQEDQLKEIEAKLQDSIGNLKDDQLKQLSELNEKIYNIKVDDSKISSNESVLDKYFVDSNQSNKFLEKEILESTDKLLKLQNLLLNLESEITKEEKKVIIDL